MNSPNISEKDMFVGQVPTKIISDLLNCIETLGFEVSYYEYNENTDEYKDAETIPTFIQEDNTIEENLLKLDRELLFVFSTKSFVDADITPEEGDKITFSGVTYKLQNRIYRNTFAHVTTLLADSILVLFTGFKDKKIKRSQL
jgi:hypothetical protein